MKLARLGLPGQEKPAVVDINGNYRDLSPVIPDINGSTLSDMSWASNLNLSLLNIIPPDTRIGMCREYWQAYLCGLKLLGPRRRNWQSHPQ